MPGKNERPKHSNQDIWIGFTVHFLEQYQLAAKRGQQAAKLGLEQSGEEAFARQLAYWNNVESAIEWLLHHVPAWARKHIV